MSYMQMAQLDELARYFADKAQTQIDALWDNGTINEQTIEAWGNLYTSRCQFGIMKI